MAAGAERMQPLSFHRVGQFLQALTARPLTADETCEVAFVLSPSQQALFRQMSTGDQRHSLQVMYTLIERGVTIRDLLVAALLHDVGKARHRLHLWERVMVVVIRAFGASTASRWGRGLPHGWRRPFVIYHQHPQWGAEMALAAGCSPLTVALIGAHHGSDGANVDSQLLRLLKHADSVN
jgi:putative nucleotidyltransferase with HDIG domain